MDDNRSLNGLTSESTAPSGRVDKGARGENDLEDNGGLAYAPTHKQARQQSLEARRGGPYRDNPILDAPITDLEQALDRIRTVDPEAKEARKNLRSMQGKQQLKQDPDTRRYYRRRPIDVAQELLAEEGLDEESQDTDLAS